MNLVHSDDGRYDAFLCFLSYNGNVTVSAEHSGLSLSAVRRRQGLSKSFAKAMDNAKEAAADRLRFEAWQRAVHGEDIPYYYQGVQVGSKRRRSDQLMAQLLRVLSQHETILDKDETSRADLAGQLADKLARLSAADAKGDEGQTD